ncbi:cupin domain-containing protein [Neolewinella litorea]|uniref:cupin domain-containing protein n=1 Tax=Neolewinella litorea TaxID=2562452 RepID=UPI001455F0B3|nr:cupin domain-containing protein [Neolewinella litorea]
MSHQISQHGPATLISLEPWEWIPNSTLPVVLYREAFTAPDSGRLTDQVKKRLHTAGWGNQWIAGIYPYPHYHSNTHEVLVILEGHCTVELGGPEGHPVEVNAGDVLLLPAGTGHACYTKSSYRVLGAYPGGRSWDLITDAAEHRPPDDLPMPQHDPIGERGVMRKVWQRPVHSG